MRTVFFGTPAWAVPSLESLLAADVEVAAVVTNPDRPAGRGMRGRPPPVKVAAGRAGIEVIQPPSARDPAFVTRVRALRPDVGTVVAYGSILSLDLLRIPPRGFVNLHFSLLPALRGAAPVQRAIMQGLTRTGVSIIVLTEGMDEGPVLTREATGISPEETAGELGHRLSRLGAPLLVPALRDYVSGALSPSPQDGAAASYAPKVTPEEARVDWSAAAGSVHDHVRGLNPVPGAWTILRGERLKLWRVRPEAGASGMAPGELASGREVIVGTGEGAVVLVEVQPSARRRMSGAELARGLRLRPGERLE